MLLNGNGFWTIFTYLILPLTVIVPNLVWFVYIIYKNSNYIKYICLFYAVIISGYVIVIMLIDNHGYTFRIHHAFYSYYLWPILAIVIKIKPNLICSIYMGLLFALIIEEPATYGWLDAFVEKPSTKITFDVVNRCCQAVDAGLI